MAVLRNSVWRPSLAAGLGVVAVGSLLALAVLVNGRNGVEETRRSESLGRSSQEIEHQPGDELSGQVLEGSHLIEAERRLTISKLKVKPGADVTFRARGTVAFGDGFQVASGARLTVGSEQSTAPGNGIPARMGTDRSLGRTSADTHWNDR